MSPSDRPHVPPHRAFVASTRRSRGYLPHDTRSFLTVLVTMRLHAAFVADLSRSPHASRLYDMLADGLRSFDPTAFRIYTWIVMPDHVHVVGVVGRAPLGATLWAFKVGTALRLNRLAARRGSVWNREFHDRTLSAEGATVSAMIYVEHNPVRAGLVSDARSWRWSGLHDRLRRAPPDYRGRLAAPSRGGRP